MGVGVVGICGIAFIGFIFGGPRGGWGGLALGLFLALLSDHAARRKKHRSVGTISCPNPKCCQPLLDIHAFCRRCHWVRVDGTKLTDVLGLVARNALMVGAAFLVREGMNEHTDPTVKYPLLLYGSLIAAFALWWQFRVTCGKARPGASPKR